MTSGLRILGLVAAFALGFAARGSSTPSPAGSGEPPAAAHAPAPEVEPRRAPRPAPGASSDGADPSPAEEQLQLKRRIAELQEALATAEEAVAARAGTPIEPPEDLPAAFTESGVEAELTALLDEVGAGRIALLDCGEFPCIAQVVFEAGEGDLFALQDRFLELYDDGVYGGHGRAWPFSMTGPESDDPILLGFGLSLQPELPADADKRIEFRIQEAMGLDPEVLVRARIEEAGP